MQDAVKAEHAKQLDEPQKLHDPHEVAQHQVDRDGRDEVENQPRLGVVPRNLAGLHHYRRVILAGVPGEEVERHVEYEETIHDPIHDVQRARLFVLHLESYDERDAERDVPEAEHENNVPAAPE